MSESNQKQKDSLKSLKSVIMFQTVATLERSLARMSTHVLLEVGRMAKVSATLGADEPRLVQMDQHVIVQRVLSGEGGRAELADVRLEARVLLVVENEAIG